MAFFFSSGTEMILEAGPKRCIARTPLTQSNGIFQFEFGIWQKIFVKHMFIILTCFSQQVISNINIIFIIVEAFMQMSEVKS